MSTTVRRIALAMTALLAVAMFFAAGWTWDLPFIWAYLGVAAAITIASLVLMDPGLLKERFRPGPGGTDRAVIPVLKVLFLGHMILAALDVGRYHWSDTIPPVVQVAGLVGFAAGFGFAFWAMLVNRYFSTIVRFQEERGHHLVTAGPYQLIRHPGYAGVLVGVLASPLALGSWVAAVPTLIFVGLILRRTVIEDRFLHRRLEGYPAYSSQVRFRLIPGLW